MKIFFIAFLKKPVSLIRWANSSIMRFPAALILLLAFYGLFHKLLYGSTQWEPNAAFVVLAMIISIIWGLFYIIKNPPITKKVFAGHDQKGSVLMKRIFIIVAFFTILSKIVQSSKLSFVTIILIFVMAEYVINTIILYKIPVGPRYHALSAKEESEIFRESEEKVDEVLSWMKGQGYVNIPKIYNSKNGRKEIRLRCNNVAYKSQEFDHILVGENGVFNIETKHYSGNIKVDKIGNWSRTDKNGNPKDDENPLMQVDRHRAVLAGILGKDIPIIDIICISYPDAILEISDDAPVPVMKYDVMARYIQNFKSDKSLSNEEIEQVVKLIEKHRVIAKEEKQA